MAESKAHKEAKSKAAGQSGQTEVPLKGGGRLDAATERRATEIERSDNQARLEQAAQRLQDSGKSQKVLQVPQQNMSKAAAAMRAKGVKGSVKNMGGTKRRSV